MATAKKSVTTTISVPVKDQSVTELLAAQTTAGAPDTAFVNTQAGPSAYTPVQDGEQSYPYSVTFTWTQEK